MCCGRLCGCSGVCEALGGFPLCRVGLVASYRCCEFMLVLPILVKDKEAGGVNWKQCVVEINVYVRVSMEMSGLSLDLDPDFMKRKAEPNSAAATSVH
jgi:hypothetical protein